MALGKQKFEELKLQLQQQQQAQQQEVQGATGQPAQGLGAEKFEELKLALQQQKKSEPIGGQRGPLRELAAIPKKIGEDFRRRKEQARATKEAQKAGEQTFGETALQAVGQGVGFLGDVVGTTVLGAAEAALPEFVERPIARGFERGVGAIAGSRPGQAIIGEAQRIQEEQPRLARNLQALGSVGEAALEIGTGGAAGAGIKAAAPTVRRAGGAALRGAGAVGGLGKKGLGLGGELVVGTRIKEGIDFAFQNPTLFDEFSTGKRTIKNVGTDLQKSTTSIADTSMKELETVKRELPKFKIDQQGVKGNIKSIRDRAFVDPGAPAKRVERVQQLIDEHTNWTPEGLLDLNTKIRRQGLYTPGSDKFQTSNKVIRDITREIKESATELIEDPRILDQLKRSSDTIEKLEDIGFVFKDTPKAKPDQMNKAIDALAKRIDDPNFAQDAKELMDFIKAETGFDIERELLGVRAFRNLTQDISQGDVVAAIRQAIGRVAGPVASEAGKLRRKISGKKEPARVVPEIEEFIREASVRNQAQRQAEQLLLPAPAPGALRSQVRRPGVVELQSRAPSTVEAEEIARLRRRR